MSVTLHGKGASTSVTPGLLSAGPSGVSGAAGEGPTLGSSPQVGRTGHKLNSDGGKCFVGETGGGRYWVYVQVGLDFTWSGQGEPHGGGALEPNGVQEPRWGALEAGGGAGRVSDEPWRQAATGFLFPGGQWVLEWMSRLESEGAGSWVLRRQQASGLVAAGVWAQRALQSWTPWSSVQAGPPIPPRWWL